MRACLPISFFFSIFLFIKKSLKWTSNLSLYETLMRVQIFLLVLTHKNFTKKNINLVQYPQLGHQIPQLGIFRQLEVGDFFGFLYCNTSHSQINIWRKRWFDISNGRNYIFFVYKLFLFKLGLCSLIRYLTFTIVDVLTN